VETAGPEADPGRNVTDPRCSSEARNFNHHMDVMIADTFKQTGGIVSESYVIFFLPRHISPKSTSAQGKRAHAGAHVR